MKANRKWHTLLLTALLAAAMLLTGASAESKLVFGDPYDAYDALELNFILHEYVEAQAILDNNPALLESNIGGNSILYKHYLDAMNAMNAGEYTRAADLYESIMENDPDFYDSQILYYYCSGRSAEAAENYTTAIAFYKKASTYGDATERMQSCREKQQAEAVNEADDNYSLGLRLQDIDLLTEALKRYTELDMPEKEALCLEAINNIQKQSSYEAALAQYNTAIASSNVSALQAARAAFVTLGDYSDSAAMVKRIDEALMTLTRMLEMESVTSDVTRLTLSWSDSQTGSASYVVTWRAENSPVSGSVTVSTRQVTLISLIPKTAYEITITPDSMPDLAITTNASTKTAKPYTENGFRNRTELKDHVLGVESRFLALKPLMELINSDKDGVVSYRDEKRLVLEDTYMDFQSLVYRYCFSFALTQEAADPVDVQWVLRSMNSGTYASPIIEDVTLDVNASLIGRIYCDMAPMLDAMYEHLCQWPTDSCTLELYINGELAAQGPLLLGE